MPAQNLPPPPGQFQAISSTTFRRPPIDGSLGLPQIFEWHAKHSAEHPLWTFAKTDGSVRSIKWPEAAAAVRRGASILANLNVPKQGDYPVVAILAQSDTITFSVTIASLLRANYTVFPISARNSPAAISHLLQKGEVEHLLVGRDRQTEDLSKAALDLIQGSGKAIPSTSNIPSFDDYFQDDAENAINASEEAGHETPPRPLDAPALILHSSGSTAFPKLIPWNTRTVAIFSSLLYFGERDLCGKRFAVHPLPMFHAMGMIQFLWSMTSGTILGVFEPQEPAVVPTPDASFAAAKATQCDFTLTVPTFVEQWAQSPECLEWLAGREGILYAGGPLSLKTRELLKERGAPVFSVYGSTELSIIGSFIPKVNETEDVEYSRLATEFTTPHMIPYGDGLYELVALENKYMRPAVVNTSVNGIPAYATSDLLEEHPTVPGLWRVYGRTDDQIMHSTGEKTNAGPLESILNQDPHIQASVMFGRGQFQAGVLVEPKAPFRFDTSDRAKVEEFRNLIWPMVEKMNAFAPQHSRVFKEMVMIAKPEKPFSYSVKFTARRQSILNDYEQEIEALYAALQESTQTEIPPPDQWDDISTGRFVRTVVTKIMSKSVADDDNLFQHGCDSLQATWIRNTLLGALRDSEAVDTRSTTQNFVYEHSTISGLTAFLLALAHGSQVHEQSREASMLAMVEKYAVKEAAAMDEEQSSRPKVVMVTGTTGGLGCHLLSDLLSDPAVAAVYAVNRPGRQSLIERQRAAMIEHGHDVDVLDSKKLTLVEVEGYTSFMDTTSPSFTHIIHNAWRVDFNVGLSAFEPNIRDLRTLVDLATKSRAKLTFISSISVLSATTHALTPEVPVDASYAAGSGYGASKWVGETLLQTAPSLDYQVVRVGQLSGAANGNWNTREWAPALVQSASKLGCLPASEGMVSWVPINDAARIIALGLNADVSIYHLVHPRPVPWSALARVISSELGVEMVSYSAWLHELEVSQLDGAAMPAKKLLPFFANIGLVKTTEDGEAFGLHRIAATFVADKDLRPFTDSDVKKWIDYWRHVGFIESSH